MGNDPTYAVISGLGGLTGKNDEVYSLEPKQGTGFLTINPGSKNALNYAAGQDNHNLDSYAYVDSTGFNFGTGDFSVECWMKPRAITKPEAIAFSHQTKNVLYGLLVILEVLGKLVMELH